MATSKKTGKKGGKKVSAAEAARRSEESAARRERLVVTLAESVARIQSGEDFKAALDLVAGRYRYSFANNMLIEAQQPGTTFVGSFGFWISKGRVPLKGRSITIRAPRFKNAKEGEGEEPGEGPGRYFVCVPVWDVADTEGPELPKFPKWAPTEGDGGAELYGALRATMQAQGFRWREEAVPDAHGTYNSTERRITIAPASPLAMLETAIHESVHALDPELAASSKMVKETLAEGTAHVVLGHFGVKSAGACEYIAFFTAQKDGAEVVKRLGDRIQKMAKILLEGMEKCLGVETLDALAA
jgi:hypothetical protein